MNAGGDTDSIGAIVGGWAGALDGSDALPAALVDGLMEGPFGRAHLERLATALARGEPPPPFSRTVAFARNLALYPVIPRSRLPPPTALSGASGPFPYTGVTEYSGAMSPPGSSDQTLRGPARGRGAAVAVAAGFLVGLLACGGNGDGPVQLRLPLPPPPPPRRPRDVESLLAGMTLEGKDRPDDAGGSTQYLESESDIRRLLPRIDPERRRLLAPRQHRPRLGRDVRPLPG